VRSRRLHGGLLLVLLGSGVLLGLDLAAPPQRQATTGLLVGAIRLYQGTLSPVLARGGVRCRFEPTCSHYAVAVLEREGALRGSWRATGRLLRCGPWTPAGTIDPP